MHLSENEHYGVTRPNCSSIWLLIHRFRVQWLEDQVAETGLAEAIAERRREAGTAGAGGTGGGVVR